MERTENGERKKGYYTHTSEKLQYTKRNMNMHEHTHTHTNSHNVSVNEKTWMRAAHAQAFDRSHLAMDA